MLVFMFECIESFNRATKPIILYHLFVRSYAKIANVSSDFLAGGLRESMFETSGDYYVVSTG